MFIKNRYVIEKSKTHRILVDWIHFIDKRVTTPVIVGFLYVDYFKFAHGTKTSKMDIVISNHAFRYSKRQILLFNIDSFFIQIL
jgi:hypothetical protein